MRHNDINLIVRECGERTVDASVSLLKELFPDQPVQRVSAGTFSAVLKSSLEAGLAAGRPWTLCVDADVLMLSDLMNFIDEAKSLPDHFFEAQALVVDKLLPSYRPAGNHLYRTKLIPYALAEIPFELTLRPESTMIASMGKAGYPYYQSSWVIGLHDFEQAPIDLYNKVALHSHKHDYLLSELLPLWRRLAKDDADFQIALLAMSQSQRKSVPDEVSRQWKYYEAHACLTLHKLIEKAPLKHVNQNYLLSLLMQAPHNLPEASVLRHRIQSDIANIIHNQSRSYLRSIPFCSYIWRRIKKDYPFLPKPIQRYI